MNTPQKVKKDDVKNRKAQRFGSTIATIVLLVVLILSGVLLYCHWMWASNSGNPANFQRVGSLIVVIELIALAVIGRVSGVLFPIGVFSPDPPKWWELVLKLVSVAIAVIGTLIWGYGDIIFTKLASQS